MKTCIYQYWYGSKPSAAVRAGRDNMKEYANKIEATYLYETDPPFFGGECSLKMKYSALRPIYDDKFLEYDKVMYIDLDVFSVDGKTENIFEQDIKHIGICEEPLQPELREQNGMAANSSICTQNDNIWASAVKKKYGMDVNRDIKGRPLVYNSGVIVLTKEGILAAREKFTQFEEHIQHLRSNNLSGFYLSDQTYYQTMLHSSGVDFKIMDYKWNSQIHWLRKPHLKVADGRTEDTNFVHVQITGAGQWGKDEHYRMVNLPTSMWNIPTKFNLD